MSSAESDLLYIKADWDVPDCVQALVTTNGDCQNADGFGAFNLATHVGDDLASVEQNRQRLQQALGLISQPLWLTQVHGVGVAKADRDRADVVADASYSRTVDASAAVLTADCLPVLFFSANPSPVVAAAHAGWRGLCTGVLEQTLQAMQVDPAGVCCWLGPAIGPAHFEVGEEVRSAFVTQSPKASVAFERLHAHKYLADLPMLARLRLQAAGVRKIYHSNLCTVSDRRFYSYRRAGLNGMGEPNPTGRMASIIRLI